MTIDDNIRDEKLQYDILIKKIQKNIDRRSTTKIRRM